MKIKLQPLPYDADSLEPYISVETIKFHYLKHHQGYVNKAKNLVRGTPYENLTVEEIIRETKNNQKFKKIYNTVAQIWNHDLYWNSMKKNGGGRPISGIEIQIKKDFRTYERFCEEIKNIGLDRFGSGYVWVLFKNGRLEITSTSNAEIPTHNLDEILFNIDLWEHSYYIDYRNKRADYIKNFLDNLLNWDYVITRYLHITEKKNPTWAKRFETALA